MPRSQIITCRLPPLRTYSADMSVSCTVPIMLRFRKTGMWVLPTAVRSGKFWELRAPIWKTSVYWPTRGTASGDMTSVMIGRPVASRASANMARPSSPRPWNEYGEVRGLNAPPRSRSAPASRTACAVSMS